MKKIIPFLTLFFVLITTQVVLAQTSSDSSSIRQKVQEKVQQVLSSPKIFLGSVTDISDSTTIQIKPLTGEIEQLSVKSDVTKVVNEVGPSAKDVKITDIAIGDFIIGMGYKDSNSVLDTRRILVITPLSDPTRKSYMGNIMSQTKTSLVLKTLKGGQQVQFTTDKNTSILKESNGDISPAKVIDLTVGAKIIISGDTVKNVFTARKILVLL